MSVDAVQSASSEFVITDGAVISALLHHGMATRPESGRSLGNTYLDLGYQYFRFEPLLNLLGIRCLEKQCQGFDQVGASLFYRSSLTRDVYSGQRATYPSTSLSMSAGGEPNYFAPAVRISAFTI